MLRRHRFHLHHLIRILPLKLCLYRTTDELLSVRTHRSVCCWACRCTSWRPSQRLHAGTDKQMRALNLDELKWLFYRCTFLTNMKRLFQNKQHLSWMCSYHHHASDQSRVTLCVSLGQQVKDSLCVVVFFPGGLEEVWHLVGSPSSSLRFLSWVLLKTQRHTHIYCRVNMMSEVWLNVYSFNCCSKIQLWNHCVYSCNN